MSDNKFDGHLFMPGVPGLEVTVGHPTVGRPTPLFGAEEAEPIFAPDPRMSQRHFVVYPKALATVVTEKERGAFAKKRRTMEEEAVQAHNQAVVVGRVSRSRDPRGAVRHREGKLVIPSFLGDVCDVAGGQAKFYVASSILREHFVEFSKATMSDIAPDMRPMATLVTIVDQPIHARPLNSDRPYEGPRELERYAENGFEVVAEFRQFVTLGMPHEEIAEFRIHSELGEYPLIVPRDVEMGMLIRMDGAVMADPDIKRNMTTEERASRLIAKLKGV